MGLVTGPAEASSLDPRQGRALQERLDALLRDLGSVLVAYSGGVDSTYLAVRAHRVLGARALAVTADSESLPRTQRDLALEIARRFGLQHRLIVTEELLSADYARNDANRCFHCKTELFRRLRPLAAAEGCAHLAYGLIADDLTDFRPGHRAAQQAGVRQPLAEVGMRKPHVRRLSREMGLPTWDLPASPCLSSRVAYGISVTAEVLARVERAEQAVRALGFREFRVRHLGSGARVEIAVEELPRLEQAGLGRTIEAAVASAGYDSVVVDPEGYRRGRLNEALQPDDEARSRVFDSPSGGGDSAV